jgi:hypothetical protein
MTWTYALSPAAAHDVSGRGWAALNPDGALEGHIYFHLGDDSAFRAERFNRTVP